MLRVIRRSIFILGSVTALLAVNSSIAGASPASSPKSFQETLTCDDGLVYHTTAVGEGLFSPAHNLNTTGILTPVAYGDITFTFTRTDGTIDVDVLPSTSKGPGASRTSRAVSCDYFSTFKVPGGTVTVTGDITVVIEPRA